MHRALYWNCSCLGCYLWSFLLRLLLNALFETASFGSRGWVVSHFSEFHALAKVDGLFALTSRLWLIFFLVFDTFQLIVPNNSHWLCFNASWTIEVNRLLLSPLTTVELIYRHILHLLVLHGAIAFTFLNKLAQSLLSSNHLLLLYFLLNINLLPFCDFLQKFWLGFRWFFCIIHI